MADNQGQATSAPIIDHNPIGERSRAKLGKRAVRARYWPAMLISMMIVVPMIVVLGLYAAIPSKALGPAPVNLGTAGNFAILARTGITTTGVTSIGGDIGVSPIDSTAMTGFGLIMDVSGTYSTSSVVTGRVYAADYTEPTPTMLTAAVGDMMTAYTDAAGRSTPDYTELGAGDITGLTLTPGLYMWTSAVNVFAAGVVLAGGASDVWIFQIAGTLTFASGASVNLSGGADASNIFWQVAGGVTIGTTAAVKGIILTATAIAMATGATLEGRALAQTAVTLDANIITPPGVVIPEFSQVLIPLVGMMFVVVIVSRVRSQRKQNL